MEILLFQTLEDRENADEIERDGPFKCTRADAWAGDGYYFWDSHIELAHFWGTRVYRSDYVICSAVGKCDETLLDLVGIGAHRKIFTILEAKVSERLHQRRITFRDIIQFARNQGWLTEFSGIRFEGKTSILHVADNQDYYRELPIHERHGRTFYLDVFPPNQLCLFYKNALSLCNYKIVHPVKYVQD